MPSLTTNLSASEPIINLVVGVSRQRRNSLIAAGKRVPTLGSIRVLIDTGAAITCIDPSIIARLSIDPSGTIDVLTPSTGSIPVQLNQYDIELAIPLANGQSSLMRTLPVIETDLSAQGIEGLLGRDVLNQGICILNGPGNSLTLAF